MPNDPEFLQYEMNRMADGEDPRLSIPRKRVTTVKKSFTNEDMAGIVFDFAGWATTRKERLTLSSSDDAAPAATAVAEFLTLREIGCNEANVNWNEEEPEPEPESDTHDKS